MALEEREVAVSLTASALDALRNVIRGEVFMPGDEGYEAARHAWNRHVRQRPAVIVAAADVADVVAAVRFAGANDLPIAVMRTGHGAVVPCNGGLLLLTERLQGVTVDPATQVARVAAGALWSDVSPVALAHGLTPLVGSTPYVSAVGYSLGGGAGWLARKFGLAVDSVRAFEIVTADGQLRHVTPESEPSLFWVVRGGGGNFGVVTSLECQLYPVGELYGGNLFYPIEAAHDVLTAYARWAKTLPDEFTTSFLMIRFPPMPHIPPALSGKTLCAVRGCYVGAAEAGEALLRPMRAAAPLAVDAFGPLPASELAMIANDPVEPLPMATWTETLPDLDGQTTEAMIRLLASAPDTPFFAIEVRHLGGSVAIQAPLESAAFSLRDIEFVLFTHGLMAAPELEPAFTRYFAEVATTLRPYATGGIYYNFLTYTDATPERGRATHTPAHYQRLAAIKAVYDPKNLFRYNPNIAPDETALAQEMNMADEAVDARWA
jgi:FAD/FMN-containing dehydrogenase